MICFTLLEEKQNLFIFSTLLIRSVASNMLNAAITLTIFACWGQTGVMSVTGRPPRIPSGGQRYDAPNPEEIPLPNLTMETQMILRGALYGLTNVLSSLKHAKTNQDLA